MNARFWLLEPAQTDTMATTTSEYQSIVCAAGHRRARRQKIGELAVNFPAGRHLSDFEWTWLSDTLISEHALRVLQRHKVTGFAVGSVTAEFEKPDTRKPPPFFELVVTGWGGMAAPAAGVKVTDACLDCRFRQYTIADPTRLFDPTAWDGSDLFMVWPLPGFRFASDRLAGILRQERISGVKLVPPAQIEVKPGAKLGPGPLDAWMPQSRALQIGRHFDVLLG
jgi:hypothetical protein